MPLTSFFPPLAPTVGWAYAAIFGLLGAITVAVQLLHRRKPLADYDDLMSRARGWWMVLLAFMLAFLAGPLGTILLFGVMSLIGVFELIGLSRAPIGRGLKAIAVAAVVGQYVLVALGQFWASLLWIPLVAGLTVPIVAMLTGPAETFSERSGRVQLALMLGGFGLSLVPALMLLPLSGQDPRGLILFIVFLTQFNDVAQYYWGKFTGRTPMVPTLSPKKTWGGFLGGVATMGVLSWAVAPLWTPLPQTGAVLVGVAAAVLGFLGDLTISALKREAGVKDAGALLPGFGGVMDRLDSLIYAAPLFYVIMYAWLVR